MICLCEPLLRRSENYVDIREGEFSDLLRRLVDGDIDLVFSSEPLPAYGYRSLKTRLIRSSDYVFVAAVKMQHFAANFPASLEGAPFLQYGSESRLRGLVDQFLVSHGVCPKRIGETDDIATQFAAVAAGLCVAVLPKTYIDNEPWQSSLAVLGSSEAVRGELTAVYLPSGPERDKAERILKEL